MKKDKKTWDEKVKLILEELEERIAAENTEKISQKKEDEKLVYRSKFEWKKKLFRQDVLVQAVKSAAFLLATVALIQGIIRFVPDTITVSNSVDGRELPIYCVETDKKQIALSFDAAWGNS